MARETINVGATANDGTGDGLRTAYIKCNNNFQELFETSLEPTKLVNGTSNLFVANSGNIVMTIAGSSNAVSFGSTETTIGGNVTIATDLNIGNSLTITQDFTIGDQLIINGSVGSNILPDTNNARTLGNATLRFAETNSVLIDASGNITSSANIAGANIIASQDVIIAGQHVTTGNVTAGNVITTGVVTATGNITGGNLVTGGAVVASATITGLSITSTGSGNVTAGGFFIGDGGFLSNVTAASNVAVTQIANGTSVVGISSSGGNVELTSGGTLAFQTNGTNLDVLIPITSANITAATGNISGGNILTGGLVSATGNVTSSANISAVNFIGNGSFLTGIDTDATAISNGTSNVTVANNADTTVGVAGTTVLQVASTGTTVTGVMTATGNVTATGNISGGNLLTGGLVNVTGNVTSSANISAVNFIGNGSFLTGIDTDATGITNGTSNVTVANNSNTTVVVAGSTILTVSATGSATTGNVSATGNVSGGNAIITGAVSGATITGNGSALSALNGSNITTGTVAAARVATLNQNTTGAAGSFSSPVTIQLTGPVTGSATLQIAGDTATIATTLTADPVITLTGDVTGSGTMTNLGSVSFATTIAANSVALGTDTTGNYVQQGATSGSGISGSVNSESGTFTVTSNATNANTGSTIVFRDASGNFSAGVITATATQARYADIAEQYLADQEYEPGTVVAIGGVYEVTLCGLGDYPAGVISTDPAYLMNSSLTAGLPIALVGRVPVRIFGSVIKGQKVYSDLMGRASKNADGSLVGISLEDNLDEGEKLVECMLKL